MNYYTAVMIICWIALAILAVLVCENDRLERREKGFYYLTYVLVGLTAFVEWLGVAIGGVEELPELLLRVVKCVGYILTPIAGGLLVVQLKHESIWKRLIVVVLTINTIFQITAAFTGWMLVVDDDNYYYHGTLYSVYVVLYLILIVLIVVEFISYGRRFRRENRVSLYATMLLMLAGILLQEVFRNGIRTEYLALTIALAMLYIHNTEFSQQAADDEIRSQQFQIMMSQIQPHFLFNCLAVIREVYKSDREKGDKAIVQFSDFLRYNVDALDRTDFIPFSEELTHIRCYLELQKLRFGEELQVEYDLKYTDFSLPALTVQPLVENAVSYGARKQKDRKGVVTITSKDVGDRIEVSVSDNGPGFLPEQKNRGEKRSHIGLENVRTRLAHACNGELTIRSVPGEGTEALILLPKHIENGGV